MGLVTAQPARSQDEAKSPDATGKGSAEKVPDEDEEMKEPALGGQVAESLRQPGEVISQSGDLKISVNPQFFAEFPGYDLDQLTQGQHDWLLKRANSVYCTCGCRDDTVARCVVLDPTCQTARQMLDKILARAGQMSEEDLAAAAAAAAADEARPK